jgi:hypothetical protein
VEEEKIQLLVQSYESDTGWEREARKQGERQNERLASLALELAVLVAHRRGLVRVGGGLAYSTPFTIHHHTVIKRNKSAQRVSWPCASSTG